MQPAYANVKLQTTLHKMPAKPLTHTHASDLRALSVSFSASAAVCVRR